MSDVRKISSLSRAWVKVPISGVEEGDNIDPTAAVVQMAFEPRGTDPTVWRAAFWETDILTYGPNKPIYYARCLVGPGGGASTGELEKGKYLPWAKLSGLAVDPESPVVFSELEFEVV